MTDIADTVSTISDTIDGMLVKLNGFEKVISRLQTKPTVSPPAPPTNQRVPDMYGLSSYSGTNTLLSENIGMTHMVRYTCTT